MVTVSINESGKITEWQLFHLAEALTRAMRLEKHREDFHKELYQAILYPTVHYDREFTGNMGSPAVDVQAIRIIELKERYDRKIQGEYDRHVRWRRLLEWADDNDRLIMIRYFEKKKSVQPYIISRLLSRIENRIAAEEERIEQERTTQAMTDFRVYKELTKPFRKAAEPPSKDKVDTKRYLINGQFESMTEEQYASHKKERSSTS